LLASEIARIEHGVISGEKGLPAVRAYSAIYVFNLLQIGDEALTVEEVIADGLPDL